MISSARSLVSRGVGKNVWRRSALSGHRHVQNRRIAFPSAALSARCLNTVEQTGAAKEGADLASSVKRPALRTLRDEGLNISVGLHRDSISLTAPLLGVEEPFHVDHVWLRDICQEANSVEAASKQKLFHTSDIRYDADDGDENAGMLQIDHVELLAPVPLQQGGDLPTLKLVYKPAFAVSNAFSDAFSSSPPRSTEPHVSHVSVARILEHASARRYARSHGDVGGTAQTWQSADLTQFPLSTRPPSRSEDVVRGAPLDTDGAFSRPARLGWGSLLSSPMDFQASSPDILSPSEIALAALVDGLLRDGIAFVTGVPTDKTGNAISADEPTSPNLARLAEMLGEIRHTFYGSLWNVRSLGSASKNIAYTNLDLGLHMDLCYFQNPPRFQFLHMLRNRVQGGQSLFVDSFAVAEHIWQIDRTAWRLLSETPVCFEYKNDNRHYRYTHPTLEVAAPTSGHAGASYGSLSSSSSSRSISSMPRLTAVNYSPPFQGALPVRWPTATSEGVAVQASPTQRAAFYRALCLFARLTHEERFRYERTLQEGECVVFDNRRVLHSRRGFEWNASTEANDGDEDVKRWLKGCYVDGDAVWSTYRVLLAKARGGSLS